jgi:small subunit ribosomal protein S6
MHQYELMVILDPEIDERTVAPSLDKFLNVIRNDGGTVDKVDIWGRRRLAYEINKKSEGIYAVVDFTAESKTTDELDRQLNLSEAVMRTKVLRAEEGIAQVAVAAKLAAEKAARKAANPKAVAPVKADTAAAPAAKVAASVKPAAAPAAAAPAAEAAVAVEAPAEAAAEAPVVDAAADKASDK